ncbi:MAG: hypothetical protein N3E46_05175 [Gemmataceae bacterium]|nr:hypothetical protein [Gemmataceae bacterium]
MTAQAHWRVPEPPACGRILITNPRRAQADFYRREHSPMFHVERLPSLPNPRLPHPPPQAPSPCPPHHRPPHLHTHQTHVPRGTSPQLAKPLCLGSDRVLAGREARTRPREGVSGKSPLYLLARDAMVPPPSPAGKHGQGGGAFPEGPVAKEGE